MGAMMVVTRLESCKLSLQPLPGIVGGIMDPAFLVDQEAAQIDIDLPGFAGTSILPVVMTICQHS